jgi:hypothetical protein
MSRTHPSAPVTTRPELPDHDQIWLDTLNLSHAPTEDRHAAVSFLNNELGMPFRNGAVFKAYNSGAIPTALVSGRACASRYDIALWAMLRKYRHLNRNEISA